MAPGEGFEPKVQSSYMNNNETDLKIAGIGIQLI